MPNKNIDKARQAKEMIDKAKLIKGVKEELNKIENNARRYRNITPFKEYWQGVINESYTFEKQIIKRIKRGDFNAKQKT